MIARCQRDAQPFMPGDPGQVRLLRRQEGGKDPSIDQKIYFVHSINLSTNICSIEIIQQLAGFRLSRGSCSFFFQN